MSVNTPRLSLLAVGSASVLLALASLSTHAAEESDQKDRQLETVTVTAEGLGTTTEQTQSYTTGAMATATKLDMSIRETPQSVSVITRTQMDDFGLTGINEVLEHTTGVTVEQIETDRVYYTARGFEITNFQIDGIGMPLTDTIQHGDVDTAIFDRVEVVRGASGLTSGTGNPSATINMVRKRPTKDFQASVKTSAGSWDDYRLDADISGAISERVGGRLVLVEGSANSYLDNYGKDTFVLYGITDFKISDKTVLTIGASRQDTHANSPMWGALPMSYTNGVQTDYDESTSTSADWSYWDLTNDSAFVEMAHSFNEDWKLTTVYRHEKSNSSTELLYMFGTPDMQTGAGLFGWPGHFETNTKEDVLDSYLTGKFELGGRQHELVAGVSHSKSSQEEHELEDPNYGFPAIGSLELWNGNIAHPNFFLPIGGSDFTDKEKAFYAAGHFQLLDPLTLTIGARVVDWKSNGDSYGVPQNAKETGKTIPYVGLVYDIDENWSTYASYTETFMPQGERDLNLNRLTPTEGNSKEIGVKSAWFDNRLNASFAVFDAKHEGLAEWVGYVGLEAVYGAEDFYSKGYEAELSGEVAPGLEATVGYTDLSIEDKNGRDARTYVPQQLFKASASYRVPQLEAMKVGASVNWQDGIKRPNGIVDQDSYALLDAFVSYDFTKNVSASLNVNNITGEKYLNSLMWDQAYYGEPRSAVASLTWKY